AEHDRDHEDVRRRDPERLGAAALLELLREDGDERRLQGGVGEQAPDQVGDLERDRERAHRALDAEVARGDDLADESRDPGESGREREERRREGKPAGRAHLRDVVGGAQVTLYTRRPPRPGRAFAPGDAASSEWRTSARKKSAFTGQSVSASRT